MSWKGFAEAIAAANGRAARAVLEAILGVLDRSAAKRDVRNSVTFTIALVSLCAKMSKADGVSSHLEAAAFHDIFHVPDDERANVERLYELARQDLLGFDTYTSQLARLLADQPEIKRDVLEALFHIAAADGLFHGTEDSYLRTVAERFGFSAEEYRSIRALFVHDPDDPYCVLGVAPDIADSELKAHYHRLVREHHPDRLLAHGVPKEFLDVATRKLQAINAAYDQIAKERGL